MIRRPPKSPLFPHPPLSRSAAPKPAPLSPATQVPTPAPPPAAQAPHSLRLAEEGYAFEVAPPENARAGAPLVFVMDVRSEEHTSELQSRLHLVCRLLLEKNK